MASAPDADATAVGQEIRRRLRSWFSTRLRRFPWREAPRAWDVFVAENLLRRTRAQQVANELPRILTLFTSPADMAAASTQDVERALEPLGLKFRAEQLHRSATMIVSDHGGDIPLSYESLLQMPGVGPYVASAVLSILTRKRVTLTDTNTVRVAKRVFGIERSGDIRRSRDVQRAVHDLLGGPATAKSWWAVIDLAAAICIPGDPLCQECPIRDLCTTGHPRQSPLKNRDASAGR